MIARLLYRSRVKKTQMTDNQAIEVVQPTVKDGVEFYVSNNGSSSGLSIRGLARLCGVDESSVRALLNALDGAGKSYPKQLEFLHGKVFSCGVTGSNGAKIVTSEAASAIIEYYAFESKAKSESALIAYRQFAKLGIDRWIKDITGYQEPVKQIGSSEMSVVLSLLGDIQKDFKELKRDVKGYHSVAVLYPLVDDLKDAIAVNSLPSSELFTITEWAEQKGISLDKSTTAKLAQAVSLAYKALTGGYAPQVTKYYPNGKARFNKCRAYKIEHFELIQQCYEQLENLPN